jgi:radical SAM superfamily enzyme YgiQ (UPF0313 family)
MPHTEAEDAPWTFATTSTGDLRLGDDQRLETVSGDRATVQDLKVALDCYRRTPEQGVEGDDPRDPAFGLNVFAATQSVQALKREIRRTLEYDDYRHDRVTAVRNIEVFRRSGRDMAVEVTISLAARPDTLTLVFDLADNRLAVAGGTNL